jgi:hypothetical protein
MFPKFSLLILLVLTGCTHIPYAAGPAADTPEETRLTGVPFNTAESYEQALQAWKTPEEISAWIAANFSYETKRAIRLSETQRAKLGQPSIYTPQEVFALKAGVCLDLSRFAVETLKAIDPQCQPKYLMIEFTPIQLSGNELRWHWLVSFKREGQSYFFADSKRPGYIAGPYKDAQEFIHAYEQYRERRIVDFREVESYEKQRRTRSLKRPAPEIP